MAPSRQDVVVQMKVATDWHQLVGAQSVEGDNTFPLEGCTPTLTVTGEDPVWS